MNRVDLVGRFTKDAEVKVANNGTSIAKFTIAVDRKIKKDGQPTADFINCVAFGKTAEFIEKYFKKGMRIGLTGSIQTGSYKDKEGRTVYTTDVLVAECEFVESKGNASSNTTNETFMDIPEGLEEELPFN